jgi:uncharacterized membrane protein YphA (DoxX/SURF4 family)
MKKSVIAGVLVVAIALGVGLMYHPETQWSGVDESVVKKFAEQAGRPPREPYINVAQGDLALFCFLVAGIVGGFAAGYHYRELFPPRTKPLSDPQHV